MSIFFLVQIEEKIYLPAEMSGKKKEGPWTTKSAFFRQSFGASLFVVEVIRAGLEGPLKVWEIFQ